MAGYISLNPEQAQQILDLYPGQSWGRVTKITPMSSGISNSNFRLHRSSGPDLLLKVSDDKSKDQLEEEQRIIEWLKSTGLELVHPSLKTKQGCHVYTWGPHQGVVNLFLEGTLAPKSKQSAALIGSALGRLHQASTTNEARQTLPRLRSYHSIGQPPSAILGFLTQQLKTKEGKELESIQKDFREVWDRVGSSELKNASAIHDRLPQGLLHGDLYSDNVMLSPQGSTVIALLDFEQSGLGAYLLDIGVCLGDCLLGPKSIEVSWLNEFLNAYQSYRRLTELEKRHLQSYLYLGLFSIALWRVVRFNQKKITHGMSGHYKELLNRALKFKQQLEPNELQ